MHIDKILKADKYCHCHCGGKYSDDEFIAILDKTIKDAIQNGKGAILVDLLEVGGDALNTFQRFEVGNRIARTQIENKKIVKIAILGKEPLLERKGLAETVARNRGAIGKSFFELSEAIQWIERNT